VTVTDPLLNETELEVDASDRLILVRQPDPDGEGGAGRPEWSYVYDANHNLTSRTDPRLAVTSYQYDVLNRLTQMVEPDPDGMGPLSAPVWSYWYDKADNLIKLVNPMGQETHWTFDALNRPLSRREPDPQTQGGPGGALWTHQYDAVGNTTYVTNPLGKVTHNVFDGLDRLTSTTDPEAGVTQFHYDLLGNMTGLTDPEGNDTTFAFDALSRVTSETNELGKSRLYRYLCPCQLPDTEFCCPFFQGVAVAARTATAEPGRAFHFGPCAVRNGSVGVGLLLDAWCFHLARHKAVVCQVGQERNRFRGLEHAMLARRQRLARRQFLRGVDPIERLDRAATTRQFRDGLGSLRRAAPAYLARGAHPQADQLGLRGAGNRVPVGFVLAEHVPRDHGQLARGGHVPGKIRV